MPAAHHRPAASPRNAAFRQLLHATIAANASLQDYFLPRNFTDDVRRNWVPVAGHCNHARDCLCGHSAGESSSRHENSKLQSCERWVTKDGVRTLTVVPCTKAELSQRCECVTGHGVDPCVYGHMQPIKILLVIAAARAAGVRTIVEEGREGGISAAIYAMHGFDVVSIE
jgi:hypothetical protein